MHQNLSTREATMKLMGDDSAHWSWNGATALVEYFEELEYSTNTKVDFDIVAIRCDFSEYDSVLEAAMYHDFIPPDDEDDEDEIEAVALQYLMDRTTVIQFEGGVIIHEF